MEVIPKIGFKRIKKKKKNRGNGPLEAGVYYIQPWKLYEKVHRTHIYVQNSGISVSWKQQPHSGGTWTRKKMTKAWY